MSKRKTEPSLPEPVDETSFSEIALRSSRAFHVKRGRELIKLRYQIAELQKQIYDLQTELRRK